MLPGRGSAASSAPSTATQKPVSRFELEDPRGFQINQIRRRFNPQESHDYHGTGLKFTLIPTDPDFQFDLKGLECLLHVPFQYPSQSVPTLKVLNQDLDVESRILVQQRFDHIVETRPSDTLLRWMNALDRQLEHALTHLAPENAAGSLPASVGSPAQRSSQGYQDTKKPITTREEKAGVHQRRQKEITQLTSRLGRDPLFKADSDGISYTIPIKPTRPDLLLNPLRPLKTVHMIVPLAYPHESCQMEIRGITDESARSIERAFVVHAATNPDMSIMAHINYLAAAMHKMANQAPDVSDTSARVSSMSLNTTHPPEDAPSTAPQMPSDEPGSEVRPGGEALQDRPHIQVIPRPPEWDFPDEHGDSDSDISNESWSEETVSDNEQSGGVTVPNRAAWQTGRRVHLNFPHMELHGVELLSVTSISVTVKCERCKEQHDMKTIKIGDDGISVPASRTEICQKCSSYLRVGKLQDALHLDSNTVESGTIRLTVYVPGFHRELMHAASNRAGTLHLDGCSAVDLLPGWVLLQFNFAVRCRTIQSLSTLSWDFETDQANGISHAQLQFYPNMF